MFALIIGGAASGKSAFAERWMMTLPGERIYLATMEAFDAESRARIARHRALRADKGFRTLELPTALERAPLRGDESVLVEDLSNLLANEMFSPSGGGAAAALRGVESVVSRSADCVVVTNEVFSGGTDYAGQTLHYLAQLAWLNRALAARADAVVEVVCGLPNVLKGALPW
jgi:adenosylcobinamide kinase/adenosylcobinamide-phosphate guanylyltransferase